MADWGNEEGGEVVGDLKGRGEGMAMNEDRWEDINEGSPSTSCNGPWLLLWLSLIKGLLTFMVPILTRIHTSYPKKKVLTARFCFVN